MLSDRKVFHNVNGRWDVLESLKTINPTRVQQQAVERLELGTIPATVADILNTESEKTISELHGALLAKGKTCATLKRGCSHSDAPDDL
jgi:hypothetical protein